MPRTVGASKYEMVARLLRTMTAADRGNNPMQRPAMTTPPTVTVGTTGDGTLTATILVSAGALTAAVNNIAWYGGVPTPVNSVYLAMPVTSVLPSTAGNIGGGQLDKNSWASAFEIETDAPTVQFGISTDNLKKIMFQVDGQYIDFVGSTGPGASADTYFKLAFASAGIRRIRVLVPTLPSTGPALVKNIRTTPLYGFWKPAQKDVMRVGWSGDSYSEGTNGAGTIYPIPNAAWPVMTCELLGLRDCRQLAVGACGYLSDNAGARSKLRDQIPRWANQAPFDLFVFANGYNDATFTAAAVTAEVLYDLQLVRSLYSNVPIVVLGCQAGNSGPGANQIATENAIAAAVTQFADPIAKFAPVSTDAPTWLNGTGYLTATNASGNSDFYVDPDHTHPSLAGAAFLSYRSARAIRTAVASMMG